MKINFLIFFIVLTPFLMAQDDSLEIELVDTNTYYSGFILQAHAAPFLTTNLYARTNINDYSNPINPKSLTEEHPAYLVAVNFGYVSNDWIALTGIHFTDRSADYTLVEDREIIVGDDTNTVEVEISYLNTYQDIHFPLSFGYITNFGKWSLAIKAGVYFSVNLAKDGYTYDFSKKEIIRLEENFSSFLVSYSLDASLKYQFSEKLGVYIEPYYISGINSIWKESPVYAWKQIHYGIAVGLEYNINDFPSKDIKQE